jgi:hypothetical protein
MVNCSCCSKEIPVNSLNNEGEGYVIRREWKRRGWRFCNECVTSKRVREWVEKEDGKLRSIE